MGRDRRWDDKRWQEAIFIGPFLVTRISAKGRILLGLSLFVLTWTAITFWEPQAAVGQWIKDTLFGAELERRSRWGYNFPLVPWISLYIVATPLGQHLAILRMSGDDRDVIRRLLLIVAMGIALVAAVKLLWFGIKSIADIDSSVGSIGYVLYSLTDVNLKLPPSFAYFVFNCSISIMLLATLFFIERILKYFSKDNADILIGVVNIDL